MKKENTTFDPRQFAEYTFATRYSDGRVVDVKPESKETLRLTPDEWENAFYHIFANGYDLWSEPLRPLVGGSMAHSLERYITIAQDLRSQCLEQLESRGPLKQGELF